MYSILADQHECIEFNKTCGYKWFKDFQSIGYCWWWLHSGWCDSLSSRPPCRQVPPDPLLRQFFLSLSHTHPPTHPHPHSLYHTHPHTHTHSLYHTHTHLFHLNANINGRINVLWKINKSLTQSHLSTIPIIIPLRQSHQNFGFVQKPQICPNLASLECFIWLCHALGGRVQIGANDGKLSTIGGHHSKLSRFTTNVDIFHH